MVNKNKDEGSNGLTITSWKKALPEEAVVAIYGHKRRGKTGTAYWLAEEAHKKGRNVATYMFPKKARKLLPSWIKHAKNITQLRKLRGYMIIADEMAIRAYARDYQTDENKELNKLMALSGQCHQLLILICQHTRQLDVGLVMEPDLIIFKQPSLLHVRFARPELKKEVQEAWDRFHAIKDPVKRKGWAFVVDYHEGDKGFLRTKLPSFWSQELSEAYALFEEELTTEKKPKKTKRKGKK